MTTIPLDHPATLEDIARMPDDDRQYEILRGQLLVTPMAAPRHNRVAQRLAGQLEAAAPAGWAAVLGTRVGLPTGDKPVPDLMLVREDAAEAELPPYVTELPALVVEVLSPGRRNVERDTVLKRQQYAAARIPTYWVLDPAEASALVLALDGDGYREVAELTARDQEHDASDLLPFPFTLRLAALL